MTTLLTRYALVWFSFLALAAPMHAQEYELTPEKWYPLEVGNIWHYTNAGEEAVGALTSEWIRQSVRDTVVDGKRWTQFATTHCLFGPDCNEGRGGWYRFSEDNYLLARYPFSMPADTIMPSQPVSIFSITAARDTLHPDSEYPLIVGVGHNEDGNEADSTHLRLGAYAHVFFHASYIYNIGSERGLIGAIVNGVEYGETEVIKQVRLPLEELSQKTDDVHLEVFPNPFNSSLTAELSASLPGRYRVSIFDALGRKVIEWGKSLSPGQSYRLRWAPAHEGFASGVYVVRVALDGEVVATQSAMLVR